MTFEPNLDPTVLDGSQAAKYVLCSTRSVHKSYSAAVACAASDLGAAAAAAGDDGRRVSISSENRTSTYGGRM